MDRSRGDRQRWRQTFYLFSSIQHAPILSHFFTSLLFCSCGLFLSDLIQTPDLNITYMVTMAKFVSGWSSTLNSFQLFIQEILYKSNGNSAVSTTVQTFMELNFTYLLNNHYKIKMCKSKLHIFLTPTSLPPYFPIKWKCHSPSCSGKQYIFRH